MRMAKPRDQQSLRFAHVGREGWDVDVEAPHDEVFGALR